MAQGPENVPELAEAERARQKLADTFGEPPPAPAGTPLSEADKAAVERVAEEIPRSHGAMSAEAEQQVSSSAGELRELSEELSETDPETAAIAREQASQMEKLI